MVSSLLAQDETLKSIPILLLTATAQIAGNVTLEVPGVKLKILKPFDNQELLSAIEVHIK
jgi:CheY-like chemotaxis protein